MTTIIIPKVIQFGPFKLNTESLESRPTRRLVEEVLYLFNEMYLKGDLDKETITRIADGIMQMWRLFDIKLELTC